MPSGDATHLDAAPPGTSRALARPLPGTAWDEVAFQKLWLATQTIADVGRDRVLGAVVFRPAPSAALDPTQGAR
jgi:hypothetical protein